VSAMTVEAASGSVTLGGAKSADGAGFASDAAGFVSTGSAVSTGTAGVSSTGAGSGSGVGSISDGVVAVDSSSVSSCSSVASTAPCGVSVSSMTVDEVSAPPELLTVVTGPSSDVDVVCVDVPADGSDTADRSAGFDGASGVVSSDCELADDSDDAELELESSVSATPGALATHVATPNVAANAPTRPMYFALPILAPPLHEHPVFDLCLPGKLCPLKRGC
jgi:hypothetical protein